MDNFERVCQLIGQLPPGALDRLCVSPGVLLAYARAPQGHAVSLLLKPNGSLTPGKLTLELRKVLPKEAQLAYIQHTVAVDLTFRELFAYILPRTAYWRRRTGSPCEATEELLEELSEQHGFSAKLLLAPRPPETPSVEYVNLNRELEGP